MSERITVEEISLFRCGSDIDLEAIFRGHISGQRSKGLKVNPIYSDISGQYSASIQNKDSSGRPNGDICVEIYETFPSVHNKRILKKTRSAPPRNKDSGETKSGITNNETVNDEPIRILREKMDEEAVHETVKRNFSDGNSKTIMNNVTSNSRTFLKDTGSLIQRDGNADRKNIFGIRNPAFDQNENPIDSKYQVIIKAETQPESETGAQSVSALNVLVTEAVVHSALHNEKGPENTTDLTTDPVSDWPDLDSITLPIDVDEEPIPTVEKNVDEQNLLKQKLVTNPEIQNTISDIKFGDSQHLNSSKSDYPSSVSVSDGKNNSLSNANSVVIATGTDVDLDVEVTTNTSLNSEGLSTEQPINSSHSSPDKYSEYDKEQLKSHSGNVLQNSSRPIKSILAITNTDVQTGNSKSKSQTNSVSEHKSVKFTEDTVFNEDRPKKYKAEQINLRVIYGGRISNDAAFVKMNPVYVENVSDLDREKAHSLTDDEKMEFRRSFHRTDRHGADRNGKIIGMEVPRYDRLLQRTIAKKRRQLCIKWMLVIVLVIIITTVATVLGVHFSDPK